MADYPIQPNTDPVTIEHLQGELERLRDQLSPAEYGIRTARILHELERLQGGRQKFAK